MTRSTVTKTIRLSPGLYADFARIARDRGDSFNSAVVSLMRGVVVSNRKQGDPQ